MRAHVGSVGPGGGFGPAGGAAASGWSAAAVAEPGDGHRGDPAEDEVAAAEAAAALGDQAGGVGRVPLAAQQGGEGVVEVVVEPAAALEPLAGPGRRMGQPEPVAQGVVPGGELGTGQAEEGGHLVGPGVPQVAGGDEGTVERVALGQGREERGADRVVLAVLALGLRPRWGGRRLGDGDPCPRPAAPAGGPRGGDGAGEQGPAGLLPGTAVLHRLAPAAGQAGEGVGRGAPGQLGVEDDDAGHGLEVRPARDDEGAEVLLGGRAHRPSVTPGPLLVAGLSRTSATCRWGRAGRTAGARPPASRPSRPRARGGTPRHGAR